MFRLFLDEFLQQDPKARALILVGFTASVCLLVFIIWG